jgi:hypothetical protein
MKTGLMTIMLFIISIFVYADNEYFSLESNLLDRGYTKFDPREYFYLYIFDDCYNEIFQEKGMLVRAGTKRIWLDINDGFEYNLFYLNERDMLPVEKQGLPNILVIVYLNNNGIISGYYKMNLFLEGTLMETNHGDILVYF